MAARYQVHLRNHDGERVAVFGGFGHQSGGLTYIELEIYLMLPGRFSVGIDAHDERIELFQDDYIVDVVRRTSDLSWYRLFTGLHRFVGYSLAEDGTEQFASQGRGLNDILAGEPIYYAPDENLYTTSTSSSTSTTVTTTSTSTTTTSTSITSTSTTVSVTTSTSTTMTLSTSTSTTTTQYAYYGCKEGPAETVAKEFVDENVGPGAAIASRRRQGFSIEADAGTGATWSGCRSYKNLLDVLVELGIHGPGDFMVEMDEPGVNEASGSPSFVFKWAHPRWGEDKRLGNDAGNPPVIFSPKRGNVSSKTYQRNRLDEINVCYVLGQGQGRWRRIVTETSGTESDTPWSRRAVARDARMTWEESELRAKGQEELDRSRRDEWADVVTKECVNTKFDVHWSLGDLVTVAIPRLDLEPDQKIVGVRIRVDENGEEITALMEDIA